MAEDCTAFVLRVGLVDALEILGEDVWEYTKFTFLQWNQQHRACRGKPELAKKILPKMTEIASTREDWFKILRLVPESRGLVIEKIKDMLTPLTDFNEVNKWPSISELPEVDKAWLQRLAEVANCAEHWRMVSSHATCNPELKNSELAAQALTKMVECARKSGKVRDWELVYYESPSGSNTQKEALAYLAQLAKTYDDWKTVWCRAIDRYNDVAKFALSKTCDSAETFDEWFSILSINKKEDLNLRLFCLNKLLKLAKTFEEWFSIYMSIDGHIKDDALEWMLSKAQTVDDWRSVWHWTPEGSEAKAKALQWLKGFVIME